MLMISMRSGSMSAGCRTPQARESDSRRRPERRAPAMRLPEDLRRCQRVVGTRARLSVRGRALRERRLPEHDKPVRLLQIVVGPEPERVDLPFRGRVHPPALVARERALLVVGRDDVLAQLGTDRLEQEAHAPDQREVRAMACSRCSTSLAAAPATAAPASALRITRRSVAAIAAAYFPARGHSNRDRSRRRASNPRSRRCPPRPADLEPRRVTPVGERLLAPRCSVWKDRRVRRGRPSSCPPGRRGLRCGGCRRRSGPGSQRRRATARSRARSRAARLPRRRTTCSARW